ELGKSQGGVRPQRQVTREGQQRPALRRAGHLLNGHSLRREPLEELEAFGRLRRLRIVESCSLEFGGVHAPRMASARAGVQRRPRPADFTEPCPREREPLTARRALAAWSRARPGSANGLHCLTGYGADGAAPSKTGNRDDVRTFASSRKTSHGFECSARVR